MTGRPGVPFRLVQVPLIHLSLPFATMTPVVSSRTAHALRKILERSGSTPRPYAPVFETAPTRTKMATMFVFAAAFLTVLGYTAGEDCRKHRRDPVAVEVEAGSHRYRQRRRMLHGDLFDGCSTKLRCSDHRSAFSWRCRRYAYFFRQPLLSGVLIRPS